MVATPSSIDRQYYEMCAMNKLKGGHPTRADLIYNMLPHPKITEILDEVGRWAAFTRHFIYLKNPLTRPQDNRLLLTTILADGINLGLTEMAESCPGTIRASLENNVQYFPFPKRNPQ